MHALYKFLLYIDLLSIAAALIIGGLKFKWLTDNLKRALLLMVIAFATEGGISLVQIFTKDTNWILKFTGPADMLAQPGFYAPD